MAESDSNTLWQGVNREFRRQESTRGAAGVILGLAAIVLAFGKIPFIRGSAHADWQRGILGVFVIVTTTLLVGRSRRDFSSLFTEWNELDGLYQQLLTMFPSLSTLSNLSGNWRLPDDIKSYFIEEDMGSPISNLRALVDEIATTLYDCKTQLDNCGLPRESLAQPRAKLQDAIGQCGTASGLFPKIDSYIHSTSWLDAETVEQTWKKYEQSWQDASEVIHELSSLIAKLPENEVKTAIQPIASRLSEQVTSTTLLSQGLRPSFDAAPTEFYRWVRQIALLKKSIAREREVWVKVTSTGRLETGSVRSATCVLLGVIVLVAALKVVSGIGSHVTETCFGFAGCVALYSLLGRQQFDDYQFSVDLASVEKVLKMTKDASDIWKNVSGLPVHFVGASSQHRQS